MGRSPLATISLNLPAIEQQLVDQDLPSSSDDEKSVDDTITPHEAAFDIEMDALNQRFAQWSRSQQQQVASKPSPVSAESHAMTMDEDYFNLVHDDPVSPTNTRNGGLRPEGSDTSDEARTPRASSPRPLSKNALFQHEMQMKAALVIQEPLDSEETLNRWSGNFDFIHPDHLA